MFRFCMDPFSLCQMKFYLFHYEILIDVWVISDIIILYISHHFVGSNCLMDQSKQIF